MLYLRISFCCTVDSQPFLCTSVEEKLTRSNGDSLTSAHERIAALVSAIRRLCDQVDRSVDTMRATSDSLGSLVANVELVGDSQSHVDCVIHAPEAVVCLAGGVVSLCDCCDCCDPCACVSHCLVH